MRFAALVVVGDRNTVSVIINSRGSVKPSVKQLKQLAKTLS